MKKLLLAFAVLFSTFSVNAQNPFAEFGYTPKIATLSNGQFNEFHDLDTIVQIGSVLFNTRSKQIVAFVEKDTIYSEATLEPDIVSRWLSPDPLTYKYASHSPYVFAVDNPILYIDPDGRDIVLYYVDDKGNKSQFSYGSKIEVPDNQFVRDAVAALDYLKTNDLANQVITKLETDHNVSVNLHGSEAGAGADGFVFSFQKGKLLDEKIRWDPSAGLVTTSGDKISPATALFHEIAHNYSALYQPASLLTRLATPNSQYGDEEEKFATENFENPVADFFGEGIRKDHKGTPFIVDGPTSTQEKVVTKAQLGQGAELDLK